MNTNDSIKQPDLSANITGKKSELAMLIDALREQVEMFEENAYILDIKSRMIRNLNDSDNPKKTSELPISNDFCGELWNLISRFTTTNYKLNGIKNHLDDVIG